MILELVKVDPSVLAEAARYRVEKPRSYGSRLQNQLAKSVENAAHTATQAASDGVKYLSSSSTDGEAKLENADICFSASVQAENKMMFLLRRAKLSHHINTVEDFKYLTVLDDNEKDILSHLVMEARKDIHAGKRVRLERLAQLSKAFEAFRKNVIDRLAKSPEKTNEALRS